MSKKLHTNREYEHELESIRTQLVKMTQVVESMIVTSVESLLTGNIAEARATIKLDQDVNRLEVDSDDQCLVMLAKPQPMASDLRFITLAMKMVTDLERIGDLAVNVSERTLALDGFEPDVVGPTLRRFGLREGNRVGSTPRPLRMPGKRAAKRSADCRRVHTPELRFVA